MKKSCVLRPICSKDATDPKIKVVNTTSRSKEAWSKDLSPFFLGPVPLYDNHIARNIENAWQYCKVYAEHADENGYPNEKYWEWAKEGWSNPKAVRFPMGRGAVPLYSYWDGEVLSYIDARKKIYAPLYAAAVIKTEAFYRLSELSKTCDQLYLFDFDGYDYVAQRKTLQQVIDDPQKKMGHAFVLTMLLQRDLCWDFRKDEILKLLDSVSQIKEERERLKEEREQRHQEGIKEKRKGRAQKKQEPHNQEY